MADKDIRRAAQAAGADRSRKVGRIHTSARARPSGRSGARAAGRKRSIGPHPARTAANLKRLRLLSARIQSEREQLFKAISIVECCKYASAGLEEAGAAECMEGIFDVLTEILDSAAGELGCIIDDCHAAQ